MADIYDWDRYKRGRWKWTGHGYEKYLERGCALGDIDAHTESSGRHLFIECKHWTDTDSHPLPPHASAPLGIPLGQLIALRDLVRQPANDVWLLYGDAPANIPVFLVELGTASEASTSCDLIALPVEKRRVYLAARIGLWQAEADGRPGINIGGARILTRASVESWRTESERESVR